MLIEDADAGTVPNDPLSSLKTTASPAAARATRTRKPVSYREESDNEEHGDTDVSSRKKRKSKGKILTVNEEAEEEGRPKMTAEEKKAKQAEWAEWCEANKWEREPDFKHAEGIEVTHKSDAKRVYNLNDAELATLSSRTFKNPHYKRGHPGSSYAVKDLITLAKRKHATLAGEDFNDEDKFWLRGEEIFAEVQTKREAKKPGITVVNSRFVPPPRPRKRR